ncbi:unknown protein [Seminavis robusta]|uniref:Uncharacterized protein n=1 Tax=Seminavis robusta TaxID=568900 RepID=A0A9N8DRQ3_9STRA|nr:unknown protein [Seminavis robusta]|eukprot:Sro232_g094080.1 n/a (353) ;mRNA; r:84070-85128
MERSKAGFACRFRELQRESVLRLIVQSSTIKLLLKSNSLTMGKERKPNFTTGLWVKERAKPHIVRHDRVDGKKYTWLVQFENADGSTEEVVKTFLQLSHVDQQGTTQAPTEESPSKEAPPPAEAPPVEATNPTNNQTPVRPKRRAAVNHRICPPPAPQSPQATLASEQSSAPDYDWSKHLEDDKSTSDSIPGFPIHSSSDDDSSDDESAAAKSTETPPPTTPTVSEPTSRADNDLEEDVLPTDERDFEYKEEHREKMIIYKQEKQELLDNEWTVEFMPGKPPMRLNTRVQTRTKHPCYGKTLRKAPDGSKWVVEFNDSTDLKELSSQSLVQIWEPTIQKLYSRCYCRGISRG